MSLQALNVNNGNKKPSFVIGFAGVLIGIAVSKLLGVLASEGGLDAVRAFLSGQ